MGSWNPFLQRACILTVTVILYSFNFDQFLIDVGVLPTDHYYCIESIQRDDSIVNLIIPSLDCGSRNLYIKVIYLWNSRPELCKMVHSNKSSHDRAWVSFTSRLEWFLAVPPDITTLAHYSSNEAAKEDLVTTTPYTSMQQHTLSIFWMNAAFCGLHLGKKVRCSAQSYIGPIFLSRLSLKILGHGTHRVWGWKYNL